MNPSRMHTGTALALLALCAFAFCGCRDVGEPTTFPEKASCPDPPDGSVDVPVLTALSWQTGNVLSRSHVYCGTDPVAVAAAGPGSPEYRGGTCDTLHAPTGGSGWLWGETYYWRIDTSIGDAFTLGDVWSFTTAYEAPNAWFHITPYDGGPAPLEVFFDNVSSGVITSWYWDFGDGGTSDVQSPTHTYEQPGRYTASLTVTGPGGTDTAVRANGVTVYFPLPGAYISATPEYGVVGQEMAFTAGSSYEITTWLWDFGDGGTSSQQNPTHIYSSTGDFTAMLYVQGPGLDDGGGPISVRIYGGAVYVSAETGDDANTGTSWDDAVETLQRAFELGEDGWLIILGPGTYYGPFDFGGKGFMIW